MLKKYLVVVILIVAISVSVVSCAVPNDHPKDNETNSVVSNAFDFNDTEHNEIGTQKVDEYHIITDVKYNVFDKKADSLNALLTNANLMNETYSTDLLAPGSCIDPKFLPQINHEKVGRNFTFRIYADEEPVAFICYESDDTVYAAFVIGGEAFQHGKVHNAMLIYGKVVSSGVSEFCATVGNGEAVTLQIERVLNVSSLHTMYTSESARAWVSNGTAMNPSEIPADAKMAACVIGTDGEIVYNAAYVLDTLSVNNGEDSCAAFKVIYSSYIVK